MITYHNSGGAGREFSKLEISRGVNPESLDLSTFQKDGSSAGIVLSPTQAVHLAETILKHFGKTSALKPMIEGDSL